MGFVEKEVENNNKIYIDMKKLLLLFSMMALAFNASAANYLTVDPVSVRPGKTTTMVVKFHFDLAEGENMAGYQVDVNCPDGISLDLTNTTLGEGCYDNGYSLMSSRPGDNTFRYVGFPMPIDGKMTLIKGTDGILLNIPLTADESLQDGTVLTGTLTDIIFSNSSSGQKNFENVEFTITIDENAGFVDLFETDEVAPEDANGADVRVYRTFTDGEWSTICLPFDMTEEQVKAAFGDGVELGDFADWEALENDKGDVSFINLSFDPVTAIEANHPYIIKTTAATYPFVVEGVTIAADEEPSVEVKHSSRIRSYMVGTYVANTTVPNNNLFLSGNKFWYSTGKTKMKAFRAYFELYDVLTSVETVGAKIFINYDGNPTSIEGVRTVEDGNNDIYSVSGQYMGKDAKRLQRGVYIVNGKKVVKK